MVKKHESDNKELSEKLAHARKEIQKTTNKKEKLATNLIKTKDELQKAVCENQRLTSDVQKLEGEITFLIYNQKETAQSHQSIGIQTESIVGQVNSNPSTSTSSLVELPI